ncbi:amino acid adenylation domain-containing protein [Nocardia sp. NPDC046473]|uniref:amino acid adenylation domain-containing protein n=1 Tax=Nocardia sp. NPDC046473 TaxID=3155733 RepID=UPI003405EF9C
MVSRITSTTLPELFARQVRLGPDRLAVTCGDTSLSYRELRCRANRLARLLIARGIGPENLVALLLPRSIDLVVAVLAILETGAAYLPIDPDNPPDRIAFVLADAAPVDVITVGANDSGCGTVMLDAPDTARLLATYPATDLDGPRVHPSAAAYVIYTSGSTGRPKGVLVPHHNVVRLLTSTNPWFDFTASDVWTLFHSYAFDFSVWELWGALAHGGRLVVVPFHVSRAPEEFHRLLVRERVTVLNQTPSAFYQLDTADSESAEHTELALRLVIFGGEALDPARLARWCERHRVGLPRLVNMYGITETTIHVTGVDVDRRLVDSGVGVIGRPIPDLRVHLLDAELRPVPEGVVGEMYVSGPGLARGYLGRRGLTAQRFVADAFGAPGTRMYRTGDLARRAGDIFEYLGRADDQVQLRGFRIEPREIESALVRRPDVAQAAVLLRADRADDARLVAYVVPGKVAAFAADAVGLIGDWRSVYDEIYAGSSAPPGADFTGWTSSYVGLPIPADHMREWRDATVAEIRELRPRRVLEIGVGTGLLLFPLAPDCESYWATDLSGVAIDRLRRQIGDGELSDRVVLRQQPADVFDGVPGDYFDTIVINSVIQYFPDADFLARVLDQAMAALVPGGAIFVGDVRDLRTHRVLQTAIQLGRSIHADAPTLRGAIERGIALEKELLVAPEFFGAFARRLSDAGAVEIRVKRGVHRNELTRHRYNVVLGKRPAGPDTWSTVSWAGMADVARRLADRPVGGLRVLGVPNARIAGELAAAAHLTKDGAVAEARALLAATDDAFEAIDPELLYALAERTGHRVAITLSADSIGGVDAVFHDSDRPMATFAAAPADRALSSYTNLPAAVGDPGARGARLRTYLRTCLPEYMVPSAVVIMAALPLTRNGKLDRAALPAPESSSAGRAPRGQREAVLCRMMADVLGLSVIGTDVSFFDLGGHSLLATRLISRIRAELGAECDLRTLLDAPTVAALAQRVLPPVAGARPPVLPRPRPESVPLSAGQRRLWFIQRSDPSSAYNVPLMLRLNGPLETGALVAAVSDVVARHELLRTVLPERAGVPVQRVLDASEVGVARVGLTPAELPGALAAAGEYVFDVTVESPMRVTLFEVSNTEHVLLLLMHHIAVDGWSVPVLLRDLGIAYRARMAAERPTWPLLPVQYADYALWQQELRFDDQLDYWRETLVGVPEELGLPVDRSRLAVPTWAGGVVSFELDGLVHERLMVLARERGATLFMVLHAGLVVLLSRLSGVVDVPVGTVVAGRSDVALDDLVGFFVNTLVLRVDVSGDPSFVELLDRVREVDLGAFAHQDVPFDEVVEAVNPVRSIARHPLFQVLLVLQNNVDVGVDFGSAVASYSFDPVGAVTAKFDVSFTVTECVGGGVEGVVEFAAELFDRVSVQALVDRWVRVLTAVAADPKMRVGGLDTLDEAERSQLLTWGRVGAASTAAACLPELFAEQVARIPGATAVVFGDTEFTYAELDQQSNRLAHLLIERGVRPESVVAVAVPRSIELVVALLAVWKAGGAYLPIDPDYPADRIEFMVTDTEPILLLTIADAPASLLSPFETRTTTTVVAVDDPDTVRSITAHTSVPITDAHRNAPLSPLNTAYIIYTSGSTGRPKGVTTTHHNVVDLVTDPCFDNVHERILVHSPTAFDASTYELWVPLMRGGAAVIAPPERLDAATFGKLVARHRVTGVCLAAGLFEAFMESAPACFAGLTQLWVGGDVLSASAVRHLLERHPGVRIANGYGPTETTTFATRSLFTRPEELGGGTLPIGGPLRGTSVVVLDAGLRLVPVGVPGELYVSGSGVARGYWARAGLTASRFVADPAASVPGDRLYRTGDVVRWRADGQLEYVGRADDQVKIRGFRIEPGEVEEALVSHAAVGRAVVVARESGVTGGGKRLVGYVVPADSAGGGAFDTESLRWYLSARLPEYLVPSAIVALAEFPLTANGKLDRNALPAPEFESGVEYRAPRTEHERILAGLFAEMLGVERVGIDDNFFALGGHSLLATRLVSRIHSVLDVDCDVRGLFSAPTVAGFAGRLIGGRGVGRPAIIAAQRPELVPVSAGQRRLWFVQRSDPSPAYNVPLVLRLTGPVNSGALSMALTDVTTRHEILRTVFAERDGVPFQQVLQRYSVPVQRVRVSAAELPAALAAAGEYVFDVTVEPPVRVTLFEVSDTERVLLLLMHHIVVDGWSVPVLLRDLGIAYRARVAGERPGWPLLPVQYADYALWQQDLRFDDQLDYWRETLVGVPEELGLPVDRSRLAVPTWAGGVVSFELDGLVHERLMVLARERGATLFMVLHAGLVVLLSRLSGVVDVPVGTVVAGRSDVALDDLVGFFVNTLVLRVDVSGDPSFVELLDRVREVDLGAFAHQDVPFDEVVEAVNPVRSIARHPLFQVLLVLQNNVDVGVDFGSAVASYSFDPVGAVTAKFDVSFTVTECVGGGVEGVVEFAAELFDRASVQALVDRWVRVLTAVAADPATRVGGFDLLRAEERNTLLKYGIGPARELPAVSLVELFEDQVDRSPDAVAVVAPDAVLTYAELDARANGLARVLLERGAGPERPVVAVISERSAEVAVAIVAVLKTGGYFVPLPASFPMARMRMVIAETGAEVVLVDRVIDDLDVEPIVLGEVSDIAERVGITVRPDQLAYVMYTSGSTGVPKGVGVRHGGVVGLVADSVWRAMDREAVLAHTSFAFDPSIYEVWLGLAFGGRVMISRSDGVLDIEEDLSTGVFAAALFNVLAEESTTAMARLGVAWSGGDVISPAGVRKLLTLRPDMVVGNAYGATETTVISTWFSMRAADAVPSVVPVGAPMDNTRVYLLDRSLGLAPVGVVGEIYVSSAGLARGYVRRPDLTASRFVADPFGSAGARMYRTGDLGRWRVDGNLDFAGRVDDQVKVRGFRVEPAEIEAALLTRTGVAQVRVVLRGDGAVNRLVAYLVLDSAAPSTDALRTGLAEILPDYMIPSAFVPLDRLPLTSNGKLDRAALPAPQIEAGRQRRPRNPREEILCGLFAEVLGLPTISIDDDFFVLGGHSLLAARLVSRVRSVLGVDCDVRTLFTAPTVARFDDRLAGTTDAADPVITARTRPERIPVSAGQRRLWFLQQSESSSAYNVPLVLRLTGPVNSGALSMALTDVTTRHEILRTVFLARDGVPFQQIQERYSVPVQRIPVDEAGVGAALAAAGQHVFDVTDEPLLRVTLFEVSDTERVLLLLMHHIVVDGWSVPVLLRDLGIAYRARVAGERPGWPLLPVQYADYALWQQELRFDDQLNYWRETLVGVPEELGLPVDRSRSAVPTWAGGVLSFELDGLVHERLMVLARERGATLFMVLHAGLVVLLSRLSGVVDVPVGTVVAGRSDVALDDLVGFFVNTLVLRVDVSGDPSFVELLDRVREVDLGAFAHQDVPFDEVVEAVNPVRSIARHPLFQVLLVLQNNIEPVVDFGEVAVAASSTHLGAVTAKFDLSFTVTECVGGGVEGVVEFAAELFDRASVQALVDRWVRVLTAVAADPEARMGDIAQWRPDGRLEYRGSNDDQVTIRGFRIDPTEIESALMSHPLVDRAVVVAQETATGRGKQLVGYVSGSGDLYAGVLRSYLSLRLPAHMVPAAVVVIDEFPSTVDGKLDCSALPAPEFLAGVGYRAPRTEQEQILAGLFADVLGVERVGVDDDFFDLGGHSLLATRLVSRVHSVLRVHCDVRALFAAPTVAGFGARLKSGTGAATPVVAAATRPDFVPASAGQRRLWFVQRSDPSPAYNAPLVLRLTGVLNGEALAAALADVVERHEILRTVFLERDGVPFQEILDSCSVPVRQLRVSESELAEALAVAGQHVFDVASESLLRVTLFEVSDAEHVLLLLMHHIVVDGWSISVLLRDLSIAYRARTAGARPGWTRLPVQYADYALWQQDLRFDDQVDYWRETLTGAPEELALPTDRTRRTASSWSGGSVSIDVDGTVHERLMAIARERSATLFMVLHAGIVAVLARLSGDTDIPIGASVAGRSDATLDDLVGFFVNTLVLRTDTSGEPTFAELLDRVRETDLGAFAHQDVPFDQVVEAVNPVRSPGRNPLFQVGLSFRNDAEADIDFAGLAIELMSEVFGPIAARNDLHFLLSEQPNFGGIDGLLAYSTDMFDHRTVELIAARLVRLLTEVAADPGQRIGSIAILPVAEKGELAELSNGPTCDVAVATIPDMFHAQVARTPDARAVISVDGTLTYAELAVRANRLAHLLIRAGVGPEDVVALAFPSSVDLVTAILAVLGSGAAYLPINTDVPPERTAFLIEDAAPRYLITARSTQAMLPATTVPLLLLDDDGVRAELADSPAYRATDTDRRASLTGAHPAYLIYTSGSTGQPKGVVVEHRSVVDYLTWTSRTYPGAGGVALVHSPVGFDLTVTALFTPLVSGGAIVLASLEDETVGFAQPAYTFIKATPSHLPLLTESTVAIAADAELLLGGEALTAEELHRWRARNPTATVWNVYGPTEATVNCTEYRIARGESIPPGPVAIGKPQGNVRIHLLDNMFRQVPLGVIGELYVAGHTLARGYHDQPGLTSARFVAEPYGPPGARMYRTGDLARWRSDGNLEFVGRADDQVKLRGFRIEPAEIEAALLRQSGVEQAAVVLRADDTDVQLVAYVVPGTHRPPPDQLRAALADALPQYMVPAAVVVIDQLPLTINGKLDRDALPAPEWTSVAVPSAPRTPQEEVMCSLFAEVLRLPRIGIDDNFFEMGGHSLLAARLIARIKAVLGTDLGIGTLLRSPTVADLSSALELATPHDALQPLLALRSVGQRPPLFCFHPGGGLAWCYSGLLRYVPRDVPVYGVQSRGLVDSTALPTSLDEMADEYVHRIRTVQPAGPYFLLGWSFGGVVAQAVATRMEAIGEQLGMVALFDAYPVPDLGAEYELDERDALRLVFDGLDVMADRADDEPVDPLRITELLRTQGSPFGSLDERTVLNLMRIATNNRRLLVDFNPQRFHGDVLLFQAGKEGDNQARAELWTPYMNGRTDIHIADCTHVEMLTAPVSAVLGPVVAALLGSMTAI